MSKKQRPSRLLYVRKWKKHPAHCGSLTCFHSFLPPVVYPPQHCRAIKSVGSGMRLVFQLHHLFTADRGQAASFLCVSASSPTKWEWTRAGYCVPAPPGQLSPRFSILHLPLIFTGLLPSRCLSKIPGAQLPTTCPPGPSILIPRPLSIWPALSRLYIWPGFFPGTGACVSAQCFSSFSVLRNHLGILSEQRCSFRFGPSLGLRFCISNKLPGDVHATGLGPPVD